MTDLHTHSGESDGSFSPAALIREAAKAGITTIALTDHDTVSGVAEAREEAQRLGLRFVPGVEIEIQSKLSGEFHLLGLGLSAPSACFLALLKELRENRERRNATILARMAELGIEASLDEIRAFSGGTLVGRPHFACFLVKNKIVKNQEAAFDRYLGKGKPLYVPKTGADFALSARLIRESGGIAVLAHPASLHVSWGRLPALIGELAEQGLDGIEAWHPNATVHACRRFETLAHSRGLFITAGSDFHGASRRDRKLGHTAGGKKIDGGIEAALWTMVSDTR
jgi:predicted metal-dependent phosphoesterase TrpH